MEYVIVAAFVVALAGLTLAGIGVVSLAERLPRNGWVGIRTPATMRDDETFRIGNKVGGLPVLVAGLVGLVGAVLAMVLSTGAVVVGALGLVGMIAIAGAGGVLGHKAALAVPEPAKELPPGCAGCACGSCGVAKLKS